MSKVAFLFPGQGAQTVGMAGNLAETPAAKELFDRATEILGYDIHQLCQNGPSEKLDSTVYSQPALFVCSLAAVEYLKTKDASVVENCAGAAGLSLGEYSAMVFAGVMKFEDALNVVQRRGEAMQAAADATPSGMVSVLGMEREPLQKLCDEHQVSGETLQIANYLCPGNIVVSGTNNSCEILVDAANQAGATKVIPLAVAGAFHTPIMQSAVEQLSEALSQVTLSAPRIPVISNVDAQAHDEPEEIRQLLVRQVVQPVLWEDSMRSMLDQGFDEFYEAGPGRVLRGLMKRIQRKTKCHGAMDPA